MAPEERMPRRAVAAPSVTPLALATLLAALSGCSAAQRVQAEKLAAEVLIPDEQEAKIGLAVRAELEEKQGVRYVEDAAVNGYVKGITDRILPLAAADRPGLTWQVRVIDDPKTVNAFATPGGYLYVYSGLLLAAADTAEVAGVLAHEAGHVVARHSARQMVSAMGLDAVTRLALGENPGGVAQLAAGFAGQTLMLAHGRGEEYEADEYGARYTAKVGYDPRGIGTFFEKLEAREGGAAPPTWLSTHPATPDRIRKVDALVAREGLSGKGGRDPAPLAAVKAGLKALPREPAKPPAAPARTPAPAR
jgi:predicted Zn-dependent protease